MSIPRRLKHLPETDWPAGDRQLFERAFSKGDIFDDDSGAGAHLAPRSRRTIRIGWRRFLGFLSAEHAESLLLPAADRVTPERIRAYVERLAA